jgi:hypothetical protein
VSALAIARRCHWRYEWVEALPADVYEILVEELLQEQTDAERRQDRW